MAEPGRQMVPVLLNPSFDTWEVAVTPLPRWLPVEGRRVRAWLAVCFDTEGERALAIEPRVEEAIPGVLERLLSRAARSWRVRPARIRVADAEVARILKDLLAPQEIPVEVAELLYLPELLGFLIAEIAPPDPRPGPLTGAGVTVERLRSYAQAATGLYISPIWRHLTSEDLIRVESPKVEESFRYAVLTRDDSGPGGLWFFPSREDFEWIQEGDVGSFLSGLGSWMFRFDRPWVAPQSDTDLWERHGLPWSGEDRCPTACFIGMEVMKRPDARQLAFLEGLMSALAATAEEDLDAGRWEKRVKTAEGSARFVLSLPELLEPAETERGFSFSTMWRYTERTIRKLNKRLQGRQPESLEEANEALDALFREEEEAGPAEPETPQDRAEQLLDQAHEARGRRMVLLARQALEIWPDCTDAYNLLAGREPDPQAALDLYARAMAAAQRAMGPEIFEQAGDFWGLVETRPYMRARQGLAERLLVLGRTEKAAEHYREMLRLNPDDNQGVRHALASLLIVLERDEEAEELLDRYEEDDSPFMAFPGALLSFRREGDSPEARRRLKRALQANRFVPGLLLRTQEVSAIPGMYSPGGREEAALYYDLSLETWAKTPGALDWLRKRTAVPARAKARTKRKKKKRR